MTAAKIVLRSGDFPTPNTPHKAIAGYIYHDGRRVADDPKFSGGVVAVPRKRVTAAQLRQRIAALAEQLEGGADPLQCAQAARKLLAA